ncbi:LacI family DNA-binding transcriptional regulator [Streptomyces sp. NPDC001933]|uniref:LacI family DNA-binding transcriptional regulator n=1 Tax=Streptomyces sp. NPDC001933 TaxID=3364626 RepID=UPI0036C0EA1E
MKAQKVTIRDVAEAAGVSQATVSLVYNEKGKIAAETRRKVLEAGEGLGYRPGWISKVFRSGRTHVIGVAVRHSESPIWEQTYLPYYRGIIAGAALEALRHGYSIAAVRAGGSGQLDEPIPFDGLIVVDPSPADPIIRRALEQGRAVVADGGYADATPGARLRSVRPALEQGIPTALDALARQGSSRPAFFRGEVDDEYTTNSQQAYEDWCIRQCIEPNVYLLVNGHSPIEGARELIGGTRGAVDGVHCLNATYSNAVTEAAAELGLSVPDDLAVSIVGEADAATDPRLVYLNLDPIEVGEQCARTLISLLDGEEPADVVLPMEVTVPGA